MGKLHEVLAVESTVAAHQKKEMLQRPLVNGCNTQTISLPST